MDAPPGVAIEKRFGISGDGVAMRDAVQGFLDYVVTVSGLASTPVAGVRAIEVEPDPCAGLPENCPPTWTDLSAILITAAGLGEITVADAGLRTLGVHASGVGDAHIQEWCDNPSGCTAGERQRLRVGNLGSSGQDGVMMDLPPDNGGIEVAWPGATAAAATSSS